MFSYIRYEELWYLHLWLKKVKRWSETSYFSSWQFSLQELEHHQHRVRSLESSIGPGLGDGGGVFVDHLEGVGDTSESFHRNFISSRVSSVDDLANMIVMIYNYFISPTWTMSSQSTPYRDLRMWMEDLPLSNPMGGLFSSLLDTLKNSKLCLIIMNIF